MKGLQKYLAGICEEDGIQAMYELIFVTAGDARLEQRLAEALIESIDASISSQKPPCYILPVLLGSMYQYVQNPNVIELGVHRWAEGKESPESMAVAIIVSQMTCTAERACTILVASQETEVWPQVTAYLDAWHSLIGRLGLATCTLNTMK